MWVCVNNTSVTHVSSEHESPSLDCELLLAPVLLLVLLKSLMKNKDVMGQGCKNSGFKKSPTMLVLVGFVFLGHTCVFSFSTGFWGFHRFSVISTSTARYYPYQINIQKFAN